MNNATTPSVSQQVRDAFNFGIQKLPLSGPDNLSTPVYGLFRDDTGDFIGSNGVTKRYTRIRQRMSVRWSMRVPRLSVWNPANLVRIGTMVIL